ncbi:LysE family translocator [Roseibium salinum]|uniref:LysE family transporter n=2 Tax=Roseibium salinum TaxID=1604349 RepID=A0ABT3R3I5_9HYPH|nr:LysE family transporter [Roseibium sp. DSM 29163]MCX2723734.1 LysE family transporter [Roseibium sp. DSM 29163]
MTFLEYAVIGYFVGILTSAPVGPVNIMAIQHAVHSGFRQAVYVGLGAVMADSIFATAALFGISAVTNFIEGQFDLIEIVGGGLLIVFGIRIWNTHPHLDKEGNVRDHGFLGDAAAAFFMAITNPGAVLAFIAIFGALGDYRPEHGNHVGALVMVTGVAGGATSWWILVSAAVSHFRARINDRWLDRANHIAGVILIAFGALIYLNLALDTFG